jgi:hypothetical protein
MFMLCRIIGGLETVSSEKDSVGLFVEKEIPDLSVTLVTPPQIHRMFEHHRFPDLLADFEEPV